MTKACFGGQTHLVAARGSTELAVTDVKGPFRSSMIVPPFKRNIETVENTFIPNNKKELHDCS